MAGDTICVLTWLVALALGAVFWLRDSRVHRRVILQRALALLERPSLFGAGPLTEVLRGQRGGRPVEVVVRSQPFTWSGAGASRHKVNATVPLPHAPPDLRLRVRRDEGWPAVQKWLGLVRDVDVSGGDRFDRRYLVEVGGGAHRGEGPLSDGRARDGIAALLSRWRLDEVAVEGVTLRVSGVTDRLDRQMLLGLFTTLDLLAQGYDRRPLRRPPAVHAEARPRYAWTGGGADARCPYCRDAFDGEVDLCACLDCGTLIHGACFDEHGSCPILGCTCRGVDRLGPIPLDDLKA